MLFFSALILNIFIQNIKSPCGSITSSTFWMGIHVLTVTLCSYPVSAFIIIIFISRLVIKCNDWINEWKKYGGLFWKAYHSDWAEC